MNASDETQQPAYDSLLSFVLEHPWAITAPMLTTIANILGRRLAGASSAPFAATPRPQASRHAGGSRRRDLAGGGRVLRFRSRGSDTVPAMLTPGELVLNRSQAKAYASGQGASRSESGQTDAILAELADPRRNLPRQIRDAVLLAG